MLALQFLGQWLPLGITQAAVRRNVRNRMHDAKLLRQQQEAGKSEMRKNATDVHWTGIKYEMRVDEAASVAANR